MQRLKAHGIPTGVVTLKEGPHPFWMSQPWLDKTAARAVEFFGRHLGTQ
jgi:pectinesterase